VPVRDPCLRGTGKSPEAGNKGRVRRPIYLPPAQTQTTESPKKPKDHVLPWSLHLSAGDVKNFPRDGRVLFCVSRQSAVPEPSAKVAETRGTIRLEGRKQLSEQVAWSVGKRGAEGVMLSFEANTAGYFGKLRQARELSRRAVASAEREEETEVAGEYEAEEASREALFGNTPEARKRAAVALGLSNAREVQFGAALAMAFSGDAARAQTLVDDLSKRFTEDTLVRFNYVPTLRAPLMLNRKDSSTASEILQAATPYELGSPFLSSFGRLYPIYVRGQSYLAAHQGKEAAGEFQKILEHGGIVVNEAIGALAHLQIGRAYAIQGDTAKARAAYQDFLTLWKDADPDIPILKQAKAEYAKLQ